jgi:hypothetical protein
MEYTLRLALLERYMDLLGGSLVDQLQVVASLAFDSGQRKLGRSQLGVLYVLCHTRRARTFWFRAVPRLLGGRLLAQSKESVDGVLWMCMDGCSINEKVESRLNDEMSTNKKV